VGSVPRGPRVSLDEVRPGQQRHEACIRKRSTACRDRRNAGGSTIPEFPGPASAPIPREMAKYGPVRVLLFRAIVKAGVVAGPAACFPPLSSREAHVSGALVVEPPKTWFLVPMGQAGWFFFLSAMPIRT